MHRVLFLGLALVAHCLPAQAAWRDAYEATVRVERPGAAGSGVVFHADSRFIWVLTNAHVTGRYGRVRVVPFQRGRQLPAVPGRVTLRVLRESLDAAVVRIPRSAWPGAVRYIPLSLAVPRPGEEIVTVGCPRADWPALWHGRVLRVAYPVFYFWPGRSTQLDLMSGRSGSAVCDAQGKRILGLFTWSVQGQAAGQCIRYVVEQLWRNRHQVPLPAGQSRQRLPEHLVSACAVRPAPCAVQEQTLAGTQTLHPATGASTRAASRIAQAASPLPIPVGPLVPVRWEQYQKPDGTLPRTYGERFTSAQDGCWPRLPWRPGRPPQPQPPTVPPAPSPGESGPVLPEAPGTTGPADESMAQKLAQLETRLNSLETTLAELRKGYEDIRQQWPQVREILLSSDIPQAKELVKRIEQLDQQLRQSVAEAEDAARRAAQAETRGLKERVAELLGRVDAMKQAVGLVSQYATARQEGAGPKAALVQALDSKLSSLEKRLESRIENISRSDIATALTYVGIPSLAATVISFFLAGALKNRLSDRLELLLSRIHERKEKE